MFWKSFFSIYTNTVRKESSESKQKWDRLRVFCECVSENEFTFSSMLHTHTHNNEICSLPFSPPLIRASCGLQIMAWLEVCWYIRPHRQTSLVELRNQLCPLAWFCAKMTMELYLPWMAWWFYMILILLCSLLFVCCLSLSVSFVYFFAKILFFFFFLLGHLGCLELRNLESCSNVIL